MVRFCIHSGPTKEPRKLSRVIAHATTDCHATVIQRHSLIIFRYVHTEIRAAVCTDRKPTRPRSQILSGFLCTPKNTFFWIVVLTFVLGGTDVPDHLALEGPTSTSVESCSRLNPPKLQHCFWPFGRHVIEDLSYAS